MGNAWQLPSLHVPPRQLCPHRPQFSLSVKKSAPHDVSAPVSLIGIAVSGPASLGVDPSLPVDPSCGVAPSLPGAPLSSLTSVNSRVPMIALHAARSAALPITPASAPEAMRARLTTRLRA